jgi:hypothetical protein
VTIDVPTRGDHIEGEPRPSKSVGRRTVLAGAAWTVPAVALAAAAPAHAASGLVLAFDKTSYSAVGCTTLLGVSVSLTIAGTPKPSVDVSVVLPNGFAFVTGGTSVSGVTDENGVYALPGITVPNASSTAVLTAVTGNVNASATVRVAANSTTALSENGLAAWTAWAGTPSGSVAIGGNYFLSPSNELWFENNRVVSNVVSAVGWYYGAGQQYADYLLADGRMQRALYASLHHEYGTLPPDARPVGQAYFLTGDGVLYHYEQRITGNVKSVVTWTSDQLHHADIELTSGVLIGTSTYTIDRTRSPLPATAKPIGADYFLSSDGDLFFKADFVAAQVTSAVGWFDGTPRADYVTSYGMAATASSASPQERAYSKVPSSARALGVRYFLTEDGDLYWGDNFAMHNVDRAVAWHTGLAYADVRTKSGANLRLQDASIDTQWSPLPENALSIGASYYYEAEKQELYYQGKLLVTGVASAAAFHWPNNGDYCDYMTVDGVARRARYGGVEGDLQGNPAGSVACGAGYFLDETVLYHWGTVVARDVISVKTYVGSRLSADFQMESGASARAEESTIVQTYSPMPRDASAVGADYFLTPGGELYFQGKLIVTDVISATGGYYAGWSHQYCMYVTSDGIGYQAGDDRPRDQTHKPGVKFSKALRLAYFLTPTNRLYFGSTDTGVDVDKVVAWTDNSYTRADVRTPDGKLQSLFDSGIETTYSALPSAAVPVGYRYFLTPSGDLYFREQLVAQGVADAIGWQDVSRNMQCADYRLTSGESLRADQQTPAVRAYTGAPGDATLLGAGYFLTSQKELWFEGTKMATDVSSARAWTTSDAFQATYRTGDGRAFRAKAADPDESTWLAGNTPLGARLIGAKYALSDTGALWFAGALVTTGVSDAVGWALPSDGSFNADYFSLGIASRAKGLVASSTTYTGVPSTAQLLGYGYQLAGSDLLYQGAGVAQNVVSGSTWVDGGPNPYCDYRTAQFGSGRVRRPDADLVIWSPNSNTPVGSDPRGADYFVNSDGVLSFQGQVLDSDASEVFGWSWNGDRFVDYRKPATPLPKRIQAKGTDKTFFEYSSQAAGSTPIGAGYWFDQASGDLWYKDSIVASKVTLAQGWAYGNPAVNYRTDIGLARRREANVTPPVTTFTQGSTPLGSKPVGAEYFLNGHDLYFQAAFVTDDVDRAIGYFVPGQGQFADYVTTSQDFFALLGAAPTTIDYTGTNPSAIPVGCGYFHVPNGKLYYNGKVLKDAQGNELGNVASVIGWSPGPRWAAYALIKDC